MWRPWCTEQKMWRPWCNNNDRNVVDNFESRQFSRHSYSPEQQNLVLGVYNYTKENQPSLKKCAVVDVVSKSTNIPFSTVYKIV